MCECQKSDSLLDSQQARGYAKSLKKIKMDPDTWGTLYKCQECGVFWEMRLPYGDRHGSGPEELHKVTIDYAKQRYKIET